MLFMYKVVEIIYWYLLTSEIIDWIRKTIFSLQLKCFPYIYILVQIMLLLLDGVELYMFLFINEPMFAKFGNPYYQYTGNIIESSNFLLLVTRGC